MRLRKVLRIGRWEVARRATLDRRGTVLAGVLLLSVVALAPVVASGTALDSGLYRVGVASDNPYYPVVRSDSTLAVREPSEAAYDHGNLEILLRDDRAIYRDTEKGRAAVADLRNAVQRYNDRRMRDEANRSAAFPVNVTLRYVRREGVRDVIAPGGGGRTDGGGGPDGGSEGPNDGDGGPGGPDGESGGPNDGDGGGGFGVPAFGAGLFGADTSTGTPGTISPPFPFRSLLLAFLFVLPLNFVIQAYGSSILSERVNRRGELLLVAPVSRGEVIAGKTLPYLAASLAVATLIAVAVGGGPLSVLAVVPLALLYLGATFVGAMFARSFKELTFVTVTVSVFLTTYAFVPAIFSGIGSIALVSPLTLVVRDLTGGTVDAASLAFATLPATLTALVLFGFGAGLYREEDMFAQRPIHLKVLDALAGRIRSVRSLALVTALLLPFVFVAELLALATLFTAPRGLALPVLLVLVALVEEVAKSLPTYAGFVHARYPRNARTAVAAGVAAGGGFFLAEKLTLAVQLVGLTEVVGAEIAFPTAGAGLGGPLGILLVLAPLALHVTTATLSALGASRDATGYTLGLAAAILLHVAYNLTVVMTLG